MDYIRTLLLEIEAAPAERPWSTESELETPRNAQLYQTLGLLERAGYIHVAYHGVYHGGAELWNEVTLTWQGHDFLDNVRDDSVWSKTKQQLAKVGGAASLEVVAQVAASFVRQALGLPG